jgi:hypothetical protein
MPPPQAQGNRICGASCSGIGIALPLPLAGEGWGGGASALGFPAWRKPPPAASGRGEASPQTILVDTICDCPALRGEDGSAAMEFGPILDEGL